MKFANSASLVVLAGISLVQPGHAYLELAEEDKTGPMWMYSNQWQGDIKATYETLAVAYGAEYAQKMVDMGIAEASPEDAERRNLDVATFGRWDTRNAEGQVVIPYRFKTGHSFTAEQLTLIRDALTEIEERTKVIKFVVATGSETYKITVQSDNTGCWSYIGRVNFGADGQPLNLSPSGCVHTGIVQHEFMHALGMYHEQSRMDRDDHVSVFTDRVISGYEHNFDKESSTNTLGVDYDYTSVMHYGPTAFGKQKINCVQGPDTCNSFARIRYVGGAGELCLTDQLTFVTCQENTPSQLFQLYQVGGKTVEIRPSTNMEQCLTANDDGVISYKTCTGEDEDRFQIHGSSLSGVVNIKWDGYNYNCFKKSNSDTLSFTQSWFSCDPFQVDFFTSADAVQACARFPVCDYAYQTETTIDAHGNTIGQRETLSDSDVLQLILAYQCPSGRRQKDSLCDSECPCFEGQFSCNQNSDCRAGLVCNEERVCVAGGTFPTESPTLEPTPSPVPTKRPTPARHVCYARRRTLCTSSECAWGSTTYVQRNHCHVLDPTISGPQRAPCTGRLSFSEAESYCAEYGNTVCTKEQLEAVPRRNNYCRLGEVYTWASDGAEHCPWNRILAIRTSDGSQRCLRPGARARTRCCKPPQ